MPLLAFIFLALAALSISADELGLVRPGQQWKYFKGTQEPSATPGAWTQVGYDESHWLPMLSALSTPAVNGEATFVFDYGAAGNYTSIYFRKIIRIEDPGRYGRLILRIDYDDGFIAYLNGQEIARRGVPGEVGEFAPFNAVAPLHLRGRTEAIDVSASLGALQAGENVLAVHLAGSGPTDSTACLSAELVGTFSRAPFVQSTTSNSTVIVWKTLEPSATFIEYGLDQQKTTRIDLPPGQTNHVAHLTGLTPDTTYHYRAGFTFGPAEFRSDWATFRTFKPSGPVTFSVLGDTGWAIEPQFKVAQQLFQADTDLIMHVGDVVYAGYSHFAEDLRFFSVYADTMRRHPFFVALGNHDSYIDRMAILNSLHLPTNSVNGTEYWYSFDHGDVHFVALWLDLQGGAQYQEGSPQYQWLENDLATTTKPWKFLFFHHTIRTSSYHMVDDYDFNGVRDMTQMEQSIGVLASRHGAQIMFTGHDHVYERLAPVGGTMNFVTGGGGAVLYGHRQQHPASVQFIPQWHFLKVAVAGQEARVEAVDLNGKIIDTVHIRRDFPERKIYQAAENTPVIETTTATDNDGNITGQKFDFIGEPVPSKTGAFSSAGRLYVNNDPENVYFGISEAMLTADQNLFLFVESPGLPGINSMAGFGNGILDPLDMGVDGFDFLDNLSFTNFAPGIGFLLGDEIADANFRSFQRPVSEFDAGQGGYFLRTDIPDLNNIRLQQYNRSPQEVPYVFEQNANFIEIAVPLNALNISPGSVIKVGMVVGRAPFSAESQTRSLDSGGLGYSVWEHSGVTYLEGVQVQLASFGWKLIAELLDDQKLELRWSASPGKTYKIQYSNNVNQNFTDLPGFPRVATGSLEKHAIDLNLPAQPDARFFRVVELP